MTFEFHLINTPAFLQFNTSSVYYSIYSNLIFLTNTNKLSVKMYLDCAKVFLIVRSQVSLKVSDNLRIKVLFGALFYLC